MERVLPIISFVFVTGSFDSNGGRGVGGSLSIDDVATTSASANMFAGTPDTNVKLTASKVTISGATNLSSNTLEVSNSINGSVISGVISGAGNLIKSGNTSLILSAANTYTGATTISAGELIIRNNAPSTSTSGFAGPGSLAIESAGTSFTSAFSTSGWVFNSDLGGLTLGKDGNTQTITVADAASIAGPITIYGGAIAINAGLTATGTNTITIKGSGNVTDGASGFVSASNLLLLGGNVTLDNSTNNAIGTLASSGVSGLTYLDSNALTIGTVDSTDGVSASGVISIGTRTGNLTVSKGIATTDGTTSAITLNAGINTNAGTSSGGNILISGSPAISMGANGVAKLYSGSVTDSTGLTALVVSGSNRFRYNSDETTTRYTTALTAGLNAIYREAISATVATDTKSVTYGDSISLTGTTTGLVNGDAASYTISNAVYSTSNNLKAITYTIVGGGPLGLGYSVTATNGTLTVAKKSITITGTTASNKVYDADIAATLVTSSSAIANGATSANDNKFYTTDDLALVKTGAAATFANKNVADGKAVTVTGFSLSGADANNYALVQPTGLTANITKADLVVSGITASNRVYDASDVAVLGGTATVSPLSNDVVTVGGTAAGAFADKNVGNGKAITITGVTISGTDAGNYNLVQQTGLTANITKADLVVSGITASNRVYNASDVAVLGGTATVSPLSNDVVTVGGTAAGAFADKNVGNGKAITITGVTISGTDAGNYNLVQQTGLTADVTAKSITITGTTASNKVYDADRTATLVTTSSVITNGAASSNDNKFYTGDAVSLVKTGAAATFANKNVADGKAVTVTGFSLSGADANNYALVQPTGLTANITKADLVVSGITASNRVYNASDVAVLGGTATVSPLSNDVVTVGGTAAGAFADKNVGNGKAITITGVTISGTDAGNYNLVQQTGLTANITKADLVVSGITASNRVYNASDVAVLGGTATVSPLSNDVVTVGGTAAGAFADKNVGNGKAITITGVTISGTDAGNYNLVQQTGLTANITKADLVVSGITASNRVYNASDVAVLGGTATVSPLSNDVVTVGGTAAGAFADKNVGNGKAITITGVTISGTDAGNYNLVQQTGLTANITKADLVVSGITASNRVYNASDVAVLGGTATVSPLSNDVVTVGGTAAGAFADKNVGNGKAITITGVTISGTDAGNYNLVQQTGLTADVTAKSITITGTTASNKVYDADRTATLVTTSSVITNGAASSNDNKFYTGDAVSLVKTGAAATFADKNVADGKAVTVTGFSLSGADANNYALVQPTGLTANITKADLVVSGITASNRVYNASDVAVLGGTATVSPLSNDVVTVGGTAAGAFADKNVGNGKAITITGVTISGTDAGNYNLVQQTGLTANITKADLVVSGITASNRVYNASDVAVLGGTATVSPLSNDVVTVGGTAAGAFADKNVGNGKAITITGVTISGTDAGNYNLVQQTGLTANITKADLVVSGITASNRVYDASDVAVLGGTATVSPLSNDVVTVGGTAAGAFANKNVGNGKAITITGVTISGTDAGNYNLVQQTGLTANITKADLVVSGITASNRVYNASDVAVLGGTATVSPLSNDVVTVGGTAAGAFADKNVGNGKAITITGVTISGTDAGNYNLVQQTGLTANITKADLVVSGITASNRVYNASDVAVLGGTATVSPLSNDVVTVGGTAAGAFADKNVGNGKAITITGVTISGTDAGNYNLVQQTGLTADVTAKSITITGTTASNKVYDADRTATLVTTSSVITNGAASSNDNKFYTGDAVSLVKTGAAATFADKNVADGKAVTVTGFSLSGADANNYALVQPTGLTANITKADLVVSGITASNRVYNASDVAVLGGTATVSPLSNDVVTVGGTAAGAFADKNVGNGKAITITGVTISGTDAGNYNLVQQTGLTANITKADLVVSGITASNRVYNASDVAVLGGTATVSPLSNDVVTVGGTAAGAFADKNVGNGKAITITGVTISGTDAGNYNLVQQTGLTANITKADLVVSGITASNRVYNASDVAVLGGTATVSPLSNDVVTVGGTAAGAFANKNVGNGKAITITGVTISGTDAGNYNLVQQTGLTANITKADLVVSGITASNRVYNASDVAVLGGTATVSPLSNDVVTVGGTAAGAFADKNVGNGKAITITGVTISGTDAGNYNLVQQTGLTADVTAKSITITGTTASNKVYDADRTATLVTTSSVITNGAASSNDNKFYTGDAVSLVKTGAAATFANKNVADGKAVTVTGFSLSGADANNYALVQPTGLTANITKADLVVSGITASNRVYNASDVAVLGGTATVSPLSNDVVTVGGTAAGAFADKNVGNGKAITITGVTISGTDAGNYNLVQQTGLTADVTAKSITITGTTASNKVYDADRTATLVTTSSVITNGAASSNDNKFYTGDAVSLVKTGAAATFADKNVADGKAVTVTGFSLSGADANNYALVQPTGLTANITKADLVVSGITASNRVYNASDVAVLGGTATVSPLSNDVVTVGGTAAGAFADKNVGNGKAITITGVTISGTDAGNYNLVQQTGLTANITKADLVVSGITASNRVYNASDVAVLGGTATVSPLSNDVVTVGGTAAGAFADKNVGNGKAITITGVTISGTDAGNYNLVQQTGLTANITKADLVVSGITASNRVYNASDVAVLGGTATVSPLSNDVVTVGGTAAGAFADKNVGNGKAITITGVTISGTDAGNYNLVQQTGLTADVTAKSITITGTTASNKVYDADRTATLVTTSSVITNGAASSNDNKFYTGDAVSLVKTGAAATFADKNVADGKAVTVTGFSLSGADANNYALVQPTGLTANITKADLVVSGITASNRVYDASDVAVLGGTATVSPLSNDVVTVGGTAAGAFADKNVGNGKAITITGVTISGTDAGNYNLVQQTGLTANITKADLVVSGITASNRVYDASDVAVLGGTATVSPLSNDVVTVGGTAAGAFADKNVGNGKAITITGVTISGTDAGNYNLVQQTGLTADVTKATLTYVATLANSIYGSTPSVNAGTVIGFVGNETSLVLTGTLLFSTTATSITGVGSYAITGSGFSSNNYQFVQAVSNATALSINQKALIITANNDSKTYGDVKIYGSGSTAFTSNGLVNSETIGSVTVTDTNNGGMNTAGAGGTYALTPSLAVGGSFNTSNYAITYVAGVLTVNKATLTVTADDKTRVYGDANPTLTYVIAGYVNSENATSAGITGTPTISTTATAASNVNSYTITSAANDLAAANYQFSYVDGTLTVNRRPVTVTADNQTRVYGDTNPDLTFTVAADGTGTSRGMYNSQSLTGALTTTAIATTNVGNVSITQGTVTNANNSNYDITFVDGTLTVNRRPVTVTADNQTRVYGDTNPDLTFTVAADGTGTSRGMYNSQSLTGALTTTAIATTNVGNVSITQGTVTNANNSNYDITYNNGTLTITPAVLTYNATAASSVYGSTPIVDAGTVTGWKNTDNIGNATTGTLLFSTTATATSNVGSYGITGSGLTANNGNYTFEQAAGNTTALTVNKATLTVTADDKTRVYGDANPTLTYVIAGYVNSENATSAGITGTPTISTTATAASNVNSYTITSAANDLAAANYQFSYVDGTLTVNRRPVTVTADNKTRVYGDTNPDLTFTVAADGTGTSRGMYNSQSLTGALTTTAIATTNVGSVSITEGTVTNANNSNYDITFNNGTLTINKARLSATGSKVYNGEIEFEAANLVVTGKAGESFGVSGSATMRTKNVQVNQRLANVNGLTLIANGNGLLANYEALGVEDTKVSVTVKTITLTAPEITKTYDGGYTYNMTSADLTAMSSLLVGGDRVVGATVNFADSVVDGVTQPNTGKNAGTGKSVVLSAVVISDGNDGNNYNYTLANTTNNTISRAPLTIAAVNDAKFVTKTDAEGYANNCGTGVVCTGNYSGAIINGFVAGETTSNLTGSLLITRTNSGTESAGLYTGVLQPSGFSSNNYNITYVNGDYTIVAAQNLLVRVRPITVEYGANPAYRISAQYMAAGSSVINTLTPINNGLITVNDGAGSSADFVISASNPKYSGAGQLVVGGYSLIPSAQTLRGSNFLSMTLVGSLTVTPKILSVSELGISGISKVYDGGTNISGLTLNVNSAQTEVLPDDAVRISGTGTFADRNVGSNKNIDIFIGLTGDDAKNYALSNNRIQSSVTGIYGAITQLASVDWVGPTTGGRWSNASNWTNGALPDASNVGTVNIGQGKAVIFDSALVGQVNSSIVNNGSIIFNGANNFNFNSTVSGSGSITQSNAGILTVSGNNSHTGGINVLGNSRLVLANANALGAGSLNMSGGYLSIQDNVSLANNLTVNGDVNLLTNVRTVGNQTYNGRVLIANGTPTMIDILSVDNEKNIIQAGTESAKVLSLNSSNGNITFNGLVQAASNSSNDKFSLAVDAKKWCCD
jgi:phosphotransferase system IIA component